MTIDKRGVALIPAFLLLAGMAPPKMALPEVEDCAGAVAVAGHVDPRGGGNDASSPGFMAYTNFFSDAVNLTSPEAASNAIVARWQFWSKQPPAAAAAKAKAHRAKRG